MRYKRFVSRLEAGALAAVMAVTAGWLVPGAAAAETVGDGVTPVYDEAYYATLDYYGNLLEGSVVKSYALNGFDGLTDRGRYDSVVNLTDGTAPVTGQGRVSFRFGDAAPERFYFEGKTAQPFEDLPWTVTVRYTLNGVPARAEDLAGQRGVVEILLDLVPNPQASEYARYNYTLEAAALFNQDDILSLEAPGAQVQLVGNLRTVLFLALPGEERHFTIRVGSDDFTFGGMTVLMMPATLAQLEEIAKLSQRKDDLEEDYRALSGSLDSLLDSLSAMESGLYETANGLDRLDLARQAVSAGKGSIYDGTDALRGDLTGISELLEPVQERVETLSQTVTDATALLNEMADTALELQDELRDLEKALSGLEDGTGDLRSVLRCAGDLQGSLRRLQSALGGTPSITPPGGDETGGGTSASATVDRVKEVHRAYEAVQDGTRAQAFEALLKLQGTGAAEAKQQAAAADQLANFPSADAAAAAMRSQARQQVLAAAGVTEADLPGLPEETQAAIQARIDQAQAQAEAQVRAQFPAVQQLNALYSKGKGASFQSFCASLPGVSSTQAKQMNDLWIIYSSGPLAGGTTLSASLTHNEAGPGGDSGRDAGGAGISSGSGSTDTGGSGTSGGSGSTDAGGSGTSGGSGSTDAGGSGTSGGSGSTDTSGSGSGDTGSSGSSGGSGSTDTDSSGTSGGTSGTDSGSGSTAGTTGSGGTSEGTDPGTGGGSGEGTGSGGDPTDPGGETPVPPSESVGGAVVDLITGGLDTAGKELNRLETEVRTEISRIAGPTATVVGDLADLCGRLSSLTGLLEDAEDLSGALRRSTREIRYILESADSLRDLLNSYEPTLQAALANTGSLSAAAVTTVRDTESLLARTEALLQDAGTQLDAGTRESLRGLSSSLRQAAGAMAATGDVKAAKGTLTTIIEDTWREYTGDINNMLMMDAEAAPVSLTDPANPAPASIQILLRTQEIQAEEPDTETEAESVSSGGTFWSRVAQMFRDFWNALTGVFH